MMYQKQKELAIMSENRAKTYVIETKMVTLTSPGRIMNEKGK
jgi:hypothetical protein